MVDEETIQLIVEAVAQGFDMVGANMKQLGTDTEAAGVQAQASGLRFTEFNSAIMLARMGISLLKQGYSDIIQPALDLSDSVRRLQRDIGATAEESSKLIYASTQVGVSADTLSRALDQAINKLHTHRTAGIEPNIEGLGKLSDAYLALAPGVDRTTFLLDNFGKAGANIAPLMMLGSAGIKDLGDQATATGTVLTQQGVDSMRKYEESARTLNAALLGLKIVLVEGIASGLEAAIRSETASIEAYRMITEALHNGSMGWAEYLGWLDKLSGGTGTVAILADLTHQLEGGIKVTSGASTAIKNYSTDLYGLKAAVDSLNQCWPTTWALAAPPDSLKDQFKGLTGAALDLAIANAQATDAAAKADDAYAKLQANTDPTKVDSLTTAWVNAVSGLNRAQDAAEKTAQALTDLNNAAVNAELKAGLADKLGAATASAANTFADSAPKLAKLNAELAKYESWQGQTITVTTKAKVSQEDYQVATERSALAEAKYQDALAGTIDKHGKLHMKTALTIEGLRITAEAARNTADDLSAGLGSSSTVIADYTTQIGKLKAQIDPLVDAENKAEAAIRKTADTMVYQALAAEKSLDPKLLTDAARQLGILSEADYELTRREEELKLQRDTGVISSGQYTQAMVELGKSFGDYQVAVAKDPTAPLPDFNPWAKQSQAALDDIKTHAGGMWDMIVNGPKADKAIVIQPGNAQQVLDGIMGQAKDLYDQVTKPAPVTVGTASIDDAQTKADALQRTLDAMHGTTVTVNVNTIWHDSHPGGVGGVAGGAAGGMDAIVPPGYPNDSYLQPVQSGERVIVIPPGQPGNGAPGGPGGGRGGGDTIIINDKLASALYIESRRQRNLGSMEAAMN